MDTNSLLAKILLAVFGAVIGFGSAVILDRIKARREPRKQLTWEASEDQGIISTHAGIKENVRILYDGNEVEDLFLVRCRVTNTGNRVVKAQRLRFKFPDKSRILDAHTDPGIPEEYGLTLLSDDDETERIYSIGQLEVGQSIAFALVVTGATIADWKIHPHNPEGDVAFTRRDAAKSLEDQAHLSAFFQYGFLLAFLPAAFYLLFDVVYPMGSAVAGAVGLTLLLLILPHLKPAIRIITTRLMADSKKGESPISLDTVHQSQIVIADRVLGSISLETKTDPGAIADEQSSLLSSTNPDSNVTTYNDSSAKA